MAFIRIRNRRTNGRPKANTIRANDLVGLCVKHSELTVMI